MIIGSVAGGLFWTLLGVGAFGLGFKGFTQSGLPLSKKRNITGIPAKVVGIFCIVVGLGFFACAISAFFIH